MREIFSLTYGSHLFGTATPSSDIDLKAVHVPGAREILLGRAKGALTSLRAKRPGEKTQAGEVEEESYSLQKYLGLLADGQTVALDMLFAPSASWRAAPAPEWHEIVANRDRLVTRKSLGFVGYCRQQASKYGIKGTRVAAARKVLGVLDDALGRLGSGAKLGTVAGEVAALAATTEHVAIVPIPQIGGTTIDHLEVCNRKLSFTATIRHGRDVVARLVDEYGHRALQAEAREGVDWKAMSHAVRIADEAIELLTTGRITLPLPNAAYILAIKQGRVPYDDVAAEIEAKLATLEAEAARSTLPAEPDRAWIDDFCARVYADAVRRET